MERVWYGDGLDVFRIFPAHLTKTHKVSNESLRFIEAQELPEHLKIAISGISSHFPSRQDVQLCLQWDSVSRSLFSGAIDGTLSRWDSWLDIP